jgi:hypothetical protein
MIRITSKKDGFWRCGVRHSATSIDYPNNRFTKEELAVLKSEPMLIVQDLSDVAAQPIFADLSSSPGAEVKTEAETSAKKKSK